MAVSLSACQISYLVKSAYSQIDLLNRRVPIEKVLQDPSLSEDTRNKLILVQEARQFAEQNLGLAHTNNYTSFVQLDRPYVTYVVSAANRFQLEPYNWTYPFLGSLPYKGFFDLEGAKEESTNLIEKGFDTYIRGVTAYSTLGWFADPLLSSMMQYQNYDLVNTIIHETVHATIYVKSEADFNEALAAFIGTKGTEAFYLQKEGANSQTYMAMKNDAADEVLFAQFMNKELQALKAWYDDPSQKDLPEAEKLRAREIKFQTIQEHFRTELAPKLNRKDGYAGFLKGPLNNALLLTHQLYLNNFDQFETLFKKLDGNLVRFIQFSKQFEHSKNPQNDMTKAIQSI